MKKGRGAANVTPARAALLAAVVALVVALASTASPGSSAHRAVGATVRVDQLGYAIGERKIAFLMAEADAAGALFKVIDASGATVLDGQASPSRGAWNRRFGAVNPLDLTALRTAGTYRIQVAIGGGTAQSPAFRIDTRATLFRPRVADAVAFFQAQRDGADVIPGALSRRASHLTDRRARVYAQPRYENADSDVIVGRALRRIGGPVDLAGGWFDAGDFIKFTHTTAYAETLLLATQRELGSHAPPSLEPEIRFGLRWLKKAWRPGPGVMMIQVGIGSGNTTGSFLGDHDLWRLPENDDALKGRDTRYLSHRPAFAGNTPGNRLPPNITGRWAAAFAMAAQVDAAANPARARRELAAAAEVLGLAKTARVRPDDVVTALPHAFYPESSWHDDLELGAAELALAAQALGDPRAGRWLRQAARWARAYTASEAGGDTLNLYDTSALAHADLVRAIRAAGHPAGLAMTPSRLLADMRAQLGRGLDNAAVDPFRAGAAYDEFDAAPHTFGLVVTAELYRNLTGSDGYAGFATAQRDWALGANPWGASLMIGVGTTYPRCPQHVVANLSGRQDGRPPILRGAVVNGPNAADLFADGLGEFFGEGHACPPDGHDRFRHLTANGSRYVDDVRAWQTVEPAIDFTAAAALAFALRSG
ncbi:MAG: endoglucanase [Gaiellales bacterium]|nr:endoglucanase [Gaiellales bacterium]